MIRNLKSVFGRNDAKMDLEACDLPAIRLDGDGEISARSKTADPLTQIWTSGHDGLVEAVTAVRASNTPAEVRIRQQGTGSAPDLTYWVTVFPEADHTVLVAHDTTLPDQVAGALVESRKMLKSLLDQAIDFAFHIDARGTLKFVSPDTPFGRPADLWLGASARSAFWAKGGAPAQTPFDPEVTGLMEAVAVDIDGQDRIYLDFRVTPIRTEDGIWAGATGIARSVSERVARDRERRMANLRLMVQNRITKILNSGETSADVLDSAAKTVLEFLRADTVLIVAEIGGALVPAAAEGEDASDIDLAAIRRDLIDRGQDRFVHTSAGRDLLILGLEPAGTASGAMVITRDTKLFPWSEEEDRLLDGIGESLAAALSKAALIDRLQYLSSSDEMTGLLNRRALSETVNRRLKHQGRTGQRGSLLFIDLDHFKEVNDTLGHKAGDDALKGVSEFLKSSIRPCDFAGRYGGDEFVVWLEDMSEVDAVKKADAVIAEMANVRAAIGAEHLRLGASVGVARSLPGTDLDFELLADRADAALYDVKRAGKGAVAVAETPTVSASKSMD